MDKSSRESLVKGLTYIDTFIQEFDLDSTIQNRATEIYRNAAQTDGMLVKRGIETIAAACIVLAVRESSDLIDAEDIAAIASAHIEKKTIYQTTKELQRELGDEFRLADPQKHVDPIGDALNATQHDRDLVATIIDVVVEDGVGQGKKAKSVAGSAYYVLTDLGVGDKAYNQKDIAEHADISPVTIRNNYREFAAVAGPGLES